MPSVTRRQVDELFAHMAERHHDGGSGAWQPAGRTKPPSAKVRLHCDGASLGNPGPAGIGVVLTDEKGEEIVAWGKAIGKTTNNVAEYQALVEGLERARQLGARSVQVRSDSELMVRQVRGEYRVRSPRLKGLHGQAMKLLEHFESYGIDSVSREANTRADSIAAKYAKMEQKRGKTRS